MEWQYLGGEAGEGLEWFVLGGKASKALEWKHVGHHTVLVWLLAVLAGVVLASTSVGAQADLQAGLTVSPLRTELTIRPGTTQRSTLKVANEGSQAIVVDLTSEIFSVINPEYDYRFDEDTEVASWVQFGVTRAVLQPGQSRSIAYDIAVPIGAEPGGRYISIFASTDSGQEEGAITSRQRVASLLYITVDGPVTREGVFLSLSAPWWVSGESAWSATLQNQGTTHFRSKYSVVVQDLFTGQNVTEREQDALILPGTVRRITDTLQTPPFAGIYRAVYTVGLGDQPAHVESRVIVYAPTWVWAVVGVVLAMTALLIMRRRKT